MLDFQYLFALARFCIFIFSFIRRKCLISIAFARKTNLKNTSYFRKTHKLLSKNTPFPHLENATMTNEKYPFILHNTRQTVADI